MRSGGIIYEGPTRKAVEYFNGLGYRCPHDVDAADFLLSVRVVEREGGWGIHKVI